MPSGYASRYSLLGAMGDELAAAFRSRGCPVNPDEPIGTRPGLFVWLNSPPSIEAIPAAARAPGSRIGLVQFFVDHPFALDAGMVDQLAELPNFRLLMPCADGSHLLRLRWPNLRHGSMLHAVPRESLCSSLDEDRPTPVVVTGSIHDEAQLSAMRAGLPEALHAPCAEMIALMTAHPWMPFEQALDVALGSRGVVTGKWPLAAGIWRYVVAATNRARRLSILRGLQGIPTDVWGLESWAPHCTGTIRYRGGFDYAKSGEILRSARVCLAWGPTQFTHSFSERALLAMAAGCATVCDDRLLVRSTLGDAVACFDAADPRAAHDRVRGLLDDPSACQQLARRGRALVERAHLWEHRLDQFSAVGSEAIAA